MALLPISPRPAGATPPAPAATPAKSSGWLYVAVGAGVALVAADTRAWPLVFAILIAALVYQLGELSGSA